MKAIHAQTTRPGWVEITKEQFDHLLSQSNTYAVVLACWQHHPVLQRIAKEMNADYDQAAVFNTFIRELETAYIQQ